MNKRSVLLEMLILESQGFIKISSKRVIEKCCGWCEGSCDDELEFRKYIEAYHLFLELNEKYVLDNIHMFGIIVMFEELDNLIDEGYDFKKAVIKMIRDKFSSIHIPLAEPPYELLSDEFKEKIRINSKYMDMYMFNGKISEGIISLEIND